MRDIIQLGLTPLQFMTGRLATGAAGAFMIADAAYSLVYSPPDDRGTWTQLVRVTRGAVGAVMIVAATMDRKRHKR